MNNAVSTTEYLTITINRSEKKTIFLGHGAPTSFRQRNRIKSAIRQAWFARPLIGAWEVSFMVGNEAVVITDNKVVRQTYTTRATYNRTLNVSLS